MNRIRSIAEIGALWPPCNRCRHIAQEHNGKGKCEAVVPGQCPTCGRWTEKAECSCPRYEGPTWEQFKSDYLTPEEIEHYKWADSEDGVNKALSKILNHEQA